MMRRSTGLSRGPAVPAADHGGARHEARDHHYHRRRTTRLPAVAALAAAALLAGLCAGDPSSARPAEPTTASSVARATPACPLNHNLVPRCGVLWGAYAQAVGGQPALEAFQQLERVSGTRFSVVHYYHQGSDLFPTPWEMQLARHHRYLLLSWKPEAGHTWAEVAAGAADDYIDREAAYLRQNYRKQFFLVIHHEPENEVIETAGSGFTAGDYRAMFRHVESRLGADGIDNAVYVMNYMGAQTYAERSWYADLWPGRRFVDWIAFDPYDAPGLNPQSGGFRRMVNRHWGTGVWRGSYRWAHQHFPAKPVMLAEWGAAEKPRSAEWKPAFFQTVVRDVRTMPQLKLLAYFSSPTPNVGGDVRPNTSDPSTAAWRALAKRSIFHRPER